MAENVSEKPKTRDAGRTGSSTSCSVAYRTVDGFITDWAVNISRAGSSSTPATRSRSGTTVRLIISLPGRRRSRSSSPAG